jgi:hypothetical protein
MPLTFDEHENIVYKIDEVSFQVIPTVENTGLLLYSTHLGDEREARKADIKFTELYGTEWTWHPYLPPKEGEPRRRLPRKIPEWYTANTSEELLHKRMKTAFGVKETFEQHIKNREPWSAQFWSYANLARKYPAAVKDYTHFHLLDPEWFRYMTPEELEDSAYSEPTNQKDYRPSYNDRRSPADVLVCYEELIKALLRFKKD